MSLPIAESGCCTGHGCDDCRTCQRGRCCRTDNPDYRLPQLGDWDGPLHGQLGVVGRPDGDKAECHICGDLFHNLLYHANVAHDVNQREYRSIFGFTVDDSLASISYGAAQRQRAIQTGAVERVQHSGLPAGFTREQWAARTSEINLRTTVRRQRLGLPTFSDLIKGRRQPLAAIEKTMAARGYRYFRDDERQQIGRLRSQGVSTEEIMRRFGGSPATIRRIAHQYRETG